jgi:hypothetical protein
MIVAVQQLDRHVSAGTDMHATIEKLLEELFSMRSMPRLHSEDHRKK